jgi:hypothetical protein
MSDRDYRTYVRLALHSSLHVGVRLSSFLFGFCISGPDFPVSSRICRISCESRLLLSTWMCRQKKVCAGSKCAPEVGTNFVLLVRLTSFLLPLRFVSFHPTLHLSSVLFLSALQSLAQTSGMEAGIPLEYLQQLREGYEEFLMDISKTIPVIKVHLFLQPFPFLRLMVGQLGVIQVCRGNGCDDQAGV